MINLRTPKEMNAIGRGGEIIAGLIGELDGRVVPGASTQDLNSVCDEYIVSHEGAVPAFKGLYGFPGSVCTSVNEEVVHGVPSAERVLSEGDILSIDVGVKIDGWCSDSAWTFRVGEVSDDVQRLRAGRVEQMQVHLPMPRVRFVPP
jgi:methionyl aminopeptidase